MMRCSVLASSLVRAAAALAVATALAAAPGAAQLARPRTASPDAPKLLVLPFVRDNQDSTLSLLVADGVREKLRSNHLDKFNPISRQNLCENLTQSGFPCDVPLEAAVVRQLVRWMNAKYVIEGSMIRRPGDSVLVVARLSEAAGADPQAATTSVTVALQRAGTGTGSELVNRLMEGYESFNEVTECRRRLDLRDYAGAIRKANDALRAFPNNAGAWVCIARVREAQNAPADSIIEALRNAYTRDTLNTTVMRRLAAKYQAKNDTVNLLGMLKRILTIDFRDNDLRISTIQMMVRMGQADSAVILANQGLRDNPASADLLGAKAIAEAAGSHWDSAFAALQTVADIDSGKVDSLFLYRITNYARQIPDTNNWIKWVQAATAKLPSQLDYWYTLASVRMVKGDSSGALDASRGLLGQLPANADSSSSAAVRGYFARAHYIIAMLMNARGLGDSAVAHADLSIRADSTIRGSVAVVYYLAGARARGDSNYTVAIERLQKAREYAAGNSRLLVPVSFQLGVAQVQLGVQLDRQAEASRACDDVRKLTDLWAAAEQNVTAGGRASPNDANNLLTNVIPAYKQRADAMTRNFCR